jgi:hypothetical protein
VAALLEAVALASQLLAMRFATVSNRVVSGLRDMCGQQLPLASRTSNRRDRTPVLTLPTPQGAGARRCKCQGIAQQTTALIVLPPRGPEAGRVMMLPVLNRLHRDDGWVAAWAGAGRKTGRMKGLASTGPGGPRQGHPVCKRTPVGFRLVRVRVST